MVGQPAELLDQSINRFLLRKLYNKREIIGVCGLSFLSLSLSVSVLILIFRNIYEKTQKNHIYVFRFNIIR